MKTALITGGTKGIGKAIAFAFLQQGYEVVLNYDSDEAAALAAQEEFNMMGYCPLLLRADVSDEKQVVDMFRDFFFNLRQNRRARKQCGNIADKRISGYHARGMG